MGKKSGSPITSSGKESLFDDLTPLLVEGRDIDKDKDKNSGSSLASSLKHIMAAAN